MTVREAWDKLRAPGNAFSPERSVALEMLVQALKDRSAASDTPITPNDPISGAEASRLRGGLIAGQYVESGLVP